MTESSGSPLSLIELADLLGRYRYVELSMFSAVGQRATAAMDASVCGYLSGASHAHSYRSNLIEARLPVSVGLPDVTTATRSPGPEVDYLVSEIAHIGDDEILGALVGAWYPAMLAGYEAHLARTSSASDAPVIRLIRRVIFDLEERIAEGETVATSLGLTTQQVAVTAALAAARGPFGTLVP